MDQVLDSGSERSSPAADEASSPGQEEQPHHQQQTDLDTSKARQTFSLSRRRLATVYDAVAGKVIKDQALRNEHGAAQQHRQPQQQQPDGQQHHHASIIQQSTRGGPFGPDEVLFRRLDAPQRYAEHDVYNAHERDLPQAGRDVLPDSHLLKSIHGYTSKFYEATKRRQDGAGGAAKGGVDEQSMDETALLAFGILLEEASREILGRRGHLVFTQGRAARPEYGPHDQAGVGGDDDTAHYSPHAAAAAAAAVGPSKSPPVRLAKRRRTS